MHEESVALFLCVLADDGVVLVADESGEPMETAFLRACTLAGWGGAV